MSLFGIDIIESRSVPPNSQRVQFRFPRSKSKRIRKKWANRSSNFRTIETPGVYMIGGKVMTSPGGLSLLKAMVAKSGDLSVAKLIGLKP